VHLLHHLYGVDAPDIRTLLRSGVRTERQSAQMSKITNDSLTDTSETRRAKVEHESSDVAKKV